MSTNPKIENILENDSILSFRLSGVDKCFANALRRTILTDIPMVVIRTEDSKVNQCIIRKNTSRLHNEIILQRLSCIPIHVNDMDFVDKHFLEINVKNDVDEQVIRMVTTKDIQLRHKETQNYLSEEEVRKIFPPNEITQHYIDLVRLRPKIGLTIPGEELSLIANFSIASARVNSMFNAVSKCTYGFTMDMVKAKTVWEEKEKQMKEEDKNEEEIDNVKMDFWNLDAQRYYLPNSYDFVIKSVGVYENKDIVHKACSYLISKFDQKVSALEEMSIPILESSQSRKEGYDTIIESTMQHSYDIILEKEDDTLGNMLSFILYELYFKGEKELSFCSFKKFHPHDSYGVLRIAYKKATEKNTVQYHLKHAFMECKKIVEEIRKMMK
jgi:DNA-directed RNA polymerase subunit L